MKVLITGGTGYIGSELVNHLEKRDDVSEIVVYDNLSRGAYSFFMRFKKSNKKVTFIEGDLLDSRKLKHSLKDVSMVYHLAAKVTTPFADQNPHLFEQTNHWGTAELVYALEESDVERMVYMSSASVYGASSNEVNEKSPTAPNTFYGISKLRGEEHVQRLMNKGFKATIIRSGNAYGYNRSMRFDSVINRFMFDANHKGRISINGNGNQHRSFVHISTVGKVLSSFDSLLPETGIHNLVENTWTINHIAHTLKDIYPNLETLYINQNLKLRELLVAPNEELLKGIERNKDLKITLNEFKERFAF